MYVYALHAYLIPHRIQKRASNPLELELCTLLTNLWMLGLKPGSSR